MTKTTPQKSSSKKKERKSAHQKRSIPLIPRPNGEASKDFNVLQESLLPKPIYDKTYVHHSRTLPSAQLTWLQRTIQHLCGTHLDIRLPAKQQDPDFIGGVIGMAVKLHPYLKLYARKCLANVLIQTFLTGTRKKYKKDVHGSQEKRAEIKALKVAYRMKHKQGAVKTSAAQKEREPAEDMVVDEASDDDADTQPTRKSHRNIVPESDNENQSDADDSVETQNEDSHQEKLLAEQEKTRKEKLKKASEHAEDDDDDDDSALSDESDSGSDAPPPSKSSKNTKPTATAKKQKPKPALSS